MTKRKIIVFTGAAVVLIGIIAAFLILTKGGHSKMKESTEVTTERKEESKNEGTSRDRGHEKEMEKKVIEVHGLGYLYYLDPDSDQEFKERLTAFIVARQLEADAAFVMEEHVDDRSDEKVPALFYLRLDDTGGTIVEVSFEKTSGHYTFALRDSIDATSPERQDRGEGQTEYEIQESTKDDETQSTPVSIKDLDGDLGRAADMKELKTALEEFLKSIDEGRRSFIVSSVGTTEKGYEAVLAFETVRHDGRNVEVKYDGTYHFRLV